MISSFQHIFRFKLTAVRQISALAALLIIAASCKTPQKANYSVPAQAMIKSRIKSTAFLTGADNMTSYFDLLKNKKRES